MSTGTSLPGTVTGINEQVTDSGPSRTEYKERSERKRLTKADIVNGTKQTREHYVKEWGGYITIRSMSEGEWQHIRQLSLRGIYDATETDPETGKRYTIPKTDYAEQARGSFEADRIMVAYGMSVDGEHWTPDEVSQFSPASVVETIALEVMKLSGLRVPNRKSRAATDTEYQEDEGSSLESEVDTFPENA